MENRLRELRKNKGLTLIQATQQLKNTVNLNISPDTLAKYERSDREPRIKTWTKLAKFYDVMPDYLQGTGDYPTFGEYFRKEVLKGQTYEEWKKESDQRMEDYFSDEFVKKYGKEFPHIQDKKMQNAMYAALDNFKNILWIASDIKSPIEKVHVKNNGKDNALKEAEERINLLGNMMDLTSSISSKLYDSLLLTGDDPDYDASKAISVLEKINSKLEITNKAD